MIRELLSGEVDLQDVLNYYDASIIYRKLCSEVHGFVFYYRDRHYIVLNKYLNSSKIKDTIIHELSHIERNHLCQANNDLFEFKRNIYEDDANKYVIDLIKDIRTEYNYSYE